MSIRTLVDEKRRFILRFLTMVVLMLGSASMVSADVLTSSDSHLVAKRGNVSQKTHTSDVCDPVTGNITHTPIVLTVSGIIDTIAGDGTAGYSGDNGPATSASLYWPHGVAVDSSGNIYIADYNNFRIRKVDTGGTITTVAGNGTFGYSGDNGLATSASLDQPYAVAVDSSGNIYIADYDSRIRKVDTGGTITTVAGNGTSGYTGDNGQATSASLYWPTGVAVDSSGNIYIADYNNFRIRKVDTGGTITTVAGIGEEGYSGDNGAATSASINAPYGVAVDPSGNFYFADSGNNRIRKVTRPMSCLCQPDGTPCNDGNPCTINDVCTNGTCAGTPKPIDHGNPCTTDACDPVTGNISHTPVADGMACNDNVFCNGTDTCSNGTCVHSGNPCKAGTTCNEATDHCDPIVVTDCAGYPAGTACDDRNACTTNDKCIKFFTKMVCKGTPVANGTSCDDGNLCTTGDSCYFGFCLGKPKNCNDNNPCTIDSCEPAIGSCKNVAKPNGTACDDGNKCTGNDICSRGVCRGTAMRRCR